MLLNIWDGKKYNEKILRKILKNLSAIQQCQSPPTTLLWFTPNLHLYSFTILLHYSHPSPRYLSLLSSVLSKFIRYISHINFIGHITPSHTYTCNLGNAVKSWSTSQKSIAHFILSFLHLHLWRRPTHHQRLH